MLLHFSWPRLEFESPVQDLWGKIVIVNNGQRAKLTDVAPQLLSTVLLTLCENGVEYLPADLIIHFYKR